MVLALVREHKRKEREVEHAYQRIGEIRQNMLAMQRDIHEMEKKLRAERIKNRQHTKEL